MKTLSNFRNFKMMSLALGLALTSMGCTPDSSNRNDSYVGPNTSYDHQLLERARAGVPLLVDSRPILVCAGRRALGDNEFTTVSIQEENRTGRLFLGVSRQTVSLTDSTSAVSTRGIALTEIDRVGARPNFVMYRTQRDRRARNRANSVTILHHAATDLIVMTTRNSRRPTANGTINIDCRNGRIF